MSFFRKLFPTRNDRELKKLYKTADKIEALEPTYSAMSDEQLRACTDDFRARYAAGETLDDMLPQAFAVVREAAKRVLGMRHYYVQLVGGIALYQGRIAEMRTGEGKTLVATLPSYLEAISGRGVHVVTVNEYLAKRDTEWMGKIHRFLGLTVGTVYARMLDKDKRAAYNCDITYGTNSEFGFDYLRDNGATSKSRKVQRELNYAIVDEVDSILIDEARTPLIISQQGTDTGVMYREADRFAKTLKRDEHFEIDEKDKTVRLLDEGVTKAEKFFKLQNLGDEDNSEVIHHIQQALKAQYMMQRDTDYIIVDGQVMIVDEFTGRVMVGRRFSEGLHQAIEAKEGVRIQGESKTIATITYQNYFRLYRKLAGMTGTAKTEETEFRSIYGMDVLEIPTNLPSQRIDNNDQLYTTRAGKLRAIVDDIKECYSVGQPTLVGTVSVEKSEELSALLDREGLPHNVLNAKNHEKEAMIIAQAGRFRHITIATNMAGRGTDILLGGNPEYLAKDDLESEYIDLAIAFKRPSDEGLALLLKDMYSQIFTRYNELSREDKAKVLGVENLRDVSDKQRDIMLVKPVVHQLIVDATNDYREANELLDSIRAEYERKLVEFKAETSADKEKVLEAGGLRIIGTERHESRRIDNQLRGRAARQGDRGSTVFYLSMEDDIARIYAGDKMKAICDRYNFPDDQPIAMKMMTGLIERAQKMVESRNYSARKNVLNYDDVMNAQRSVIYEQRGRILNQDDVHQEILDMMEPLVDDLVAYYVEPELDVTEWDVQGFNNAINDRLMATVGEDVVTEDNLHGKTAAQIREMILNAAQSALTARRDEIAAAGGLRQVSPDGSERTITFADLERGILLFNVDKHWVEHIDAMDTLRRGIGLRSYGQTDPVMSYRKEGFDMFDEMVFHIQRDTIKRLANDLSNIREIRRSQHAAEQAVSSAQSAQHAGGSIGRNSPCPCGSGKKYKNCCGK